MDRWVWITAVMMQRYSFGAFLLVFLDFPLLILFHQVTLEIQTNVPREQGEDTLSETSSEQLKDAKDLNQEELSKSTDRNQQNEFQLPASLLE
jgi:hypothetical protein